MMDAGERVKPPGEPPDGSCTWANMVAGGHRGSRSVPEKVVDAAFVTERMSLEFPDGEDGEPVITIGHEVLEAMNDIWKQCIIVKVLGRNVGLPVLNRKLRDLWKPQGGMSIVDLPRQFFMVRFEKEEEYLAALTGGPWRVFGSYLLVQGWTPEFDPMRDEIRTTPVWVRLSNIPVNFYHEAILFGIAKGVGKPVRVDLTTLHLERARFARVCVEVNLAKPLKGSVRINGERYYVYYEGLSQICSICGVYGHSVHKCPKKPMEQLGEKIGDVASPASHQVDQNNSTPGDGFTVVRQQGWRGRRGDNHDRQNAGGRGNQLNENHGRNLREIVNPVNMETSQSQNRFSTLMEDTVSLERSEIEKDADLNKEKESNKENTLIAPQAGEIISSQSAINGLQFEGRNEVGGQNPTGPITKKRNGPKGRAGPVKAKGQKTQQPTRGLIFGPTRRELELSSCGKRLRTDDGESRRDGGVFSVERTPTSSADLRQHEDKHLQESNENHAETRTGGSSQSLPVSSILVSHHV